MDINETYVRIGEYISSHQSQTYGEIGTTLGLSRATVARIARLRGIKRRPGKRLAALEAAVAAIEAADPQAGSVPTGEAAAPPTEEPICAAPGAPPMEATLLSTPDTPPGEIAVV
jgi:hypothetical protein